MIFIISLIKIMNVNVTGPLPLRTKPKPEGKDQIRKVRKQTTRSGNFGGGE